MVCLVALILGFSKAFRSRSNMFQVGWLQVHLLLPIIVVCVLLEWTGEHQESMAEAGKGDYKSRMVTLSHLVGFDLGQPYLRAVPARIVYLLSLLAFVLTWIQPACVRIVYPDRKFTDKTVKMEGVPTLFSSSTLLLASTVVAPIILITDVVFVPGVLLVLLAALLIVQIAAVRYEAFSR